MSFEQQRGPSSSSQSWSVKAPAVGSSANTLIGAPTKPPVDSPASGPTSGRPADVQSVAEDAQKKVGQAVDQVRERGKSQLATEKDRVAGTVGSVAHALRETGRQLHQSSDPTVADYVDRVADSVDQFSNHLRQRNVDELIGDTETFARRQPALFLGGAFLIGLAAARFLKSSRPEPAPVTQAYSSTAGTSYRPPATAPYSWQGGSSSFSNGPKSSS